MDRSAKRNVWYRENFKQPRRRVGKGDPRRIWIPVLIVVCVLALLVGSSLLFSDPAGPAAPPQDMHPFHAEPPGFFDRYYSFAPADPESEIARYAPRGDLTLALESAEGQEMLSLQALYQQCAPSVVSVLAYPGNRSGYYRGTGIVLSADGYILTNQHVIGGTDSAVVILTDGSEYDALLVGEDLHTDLAVLKIEAKGLVPAGFGDSGELVVGDEVAAIGNPVSAELNGTMTTGIVSAINRNISVNGRQMTLLQTDAAINSGSSGGALINRYGQVIGVTNMKFVATYNIAPVEGLSFAIPSAVVKTVADQLIANGKVVGRPGLGITVGAVTPEMTDEFGYPEGLYIGSVSEGSDAAAQGIRPGDVLLQVDGQPVRQSDDLLKIRDAHAVGDVLTFTLWREGSTFDLKVKVVDLNEISY